ncbi:MAG: hypothetical protein ACYDG2_11700 [Ruminiclostridium sp.]
MNNLRESVGEGLVFLLAKRLDVVLSITMSHGWRMCATVKVTRLSRYSLANYSLSEPIVTANAVLLIVLINLHAA